MKKIIFLIFALSTFLISCEKINIDGISNSSVPEIASDGSNVIKLPIPENSLVAQSWWNEVELIEIDPLNSMVKTKVKFNFRPCTTQCGCSGGGGICFCAGCKIIDSGTLNEEDIEEGFGIVGLGYLGKNELIVTYLDRYNYNEKMETIIDGNIILDNSMCKQLGINKNSVEIKAGTYFVTPSKVSKYGQFIVKI